MTQRTESETAVALLPCPFCGGKAEIERIGNHLVSTQYACTECGCFLETGEEFSHGRQWNTRTPSQPAASGVVGAPMVADIAQIISVGYANGKTAPEIAEAVFREFEVKP